MSSKALFVRLLIVLAFFGLKLKAQEKTAVYRELYRPQLHFSPKEKWMNDPNGMVYYKGTYHLFFQHYPNGNTWGPMHWGHAVSRDLIHWKQLPIALYPDSLGYIFSGSAVIDSNNTSGFGKNGQVPMVAIFTHHDPKGEKAGNNNFQNQSIAYSLDEGKTWIKYAGNPVLKNPGIRDFRDPKVMWYAAEKKWVMTLATLDHITFFSSPDLKTWKKESEFGKELGAHGGVWECPDLFPMKLGRNTYWVLIVNLNPGGPNGGSATQYFVGNFDGETFKPLTTDTKWLDYGPDEYAGITWSNTGDRKIFLGWMSNWLYANEVPTATWRNAMTIPRKLALVNVNKQLLLSSVPVKELTNTLKNQKKPANLLLNITHAQNVPAQYELNLKIDKLSDYSITLFNDANEKVVFGYEKVGNRYFIDRTKSGKVNFNKEFANKIFYAPRFSVLNYANLKVVVDASSIELFADDGSTVMTCIFFPAKPLNKISFKKGSNLKLSTFDIMPLASIWKE